MSGDMKLLLNLIQLSLNSRKNLLQMTLFCLKVTLHVMEKRQQEQMFSRLPD